MFGFVNIVSVYVGNALIAFDGRCVPNAIVKVFGVAKKKKTVGGTEICTTYCYSDWHLYDIVLIDL